MINNTIFDLEHIPNIFEQIPIQTLKLLSVKNEVNVHNYIMKYSFAKIMN